MIFFINLFLIRVSFSLILFLKYLFYKFYFKNISKNFNLKNSYYRNFKKTFFQNEIHQKIKRGLEFLIKLKVNKYANN